MAVGLFRNGNVLTEHSKILVDEKAAAVLTDERKSRKSGLVECGAV